MEAPALGPVGEVVGGGLLQRQLLGQPLVLLLGDHGGRGGGGGGGGGALVAAGDQAVAGAGDFGVGLRVGAVARGGAGRGVAGL